MRSKTLKAWLEAHGMKALHLSEEADVDASSLSRFINRKSGLSARHMQRIARVTAELDPKNPLTIDDLIREAEARS